MKNSSFGVLGNSVAGVIGGGIGGQLLGLLGVGSASGGLDPASIIASVAGGGIGGGVLMAVIGMVRKAMAKT